MSRALTATVEEVVRETADAVSLVLRPRTEEGVELAPEPGQFLTVRIPGGGARCYSFSRVGRRPRITVKRVAGGLGSGWLCDEAAPGMRLTVLPPAGAFTPRTVGGDLLLVAGGSGITPVLSLATAALRRGGGRVVLCYANRDENAVIFRDELRELAAAHPGRLLVVHLLESLGGLPTRELLGQLLAPYAAFEAYLCGPGPFMDAAAEALAAHGAPRGRIHREVFVSLTGDAFAEPEPGPGTESAEETGTGPGPGTAPSSAQAATGSGPAGRQRAEVTVELDGVIRTLPWRPGATLLDALAEGDVDAPFSCREGSCGACACRLVKGEVEQRTRGVLTDEDRAEGYILACQALAPENGDPVGISYD